jgi:hypothetical protein
LIALPSSLNVPVNRCANPGALFQNRQVSAVMSTANYSMHAAGVEVCMDGFPSMIPMTAIASGISGWS